MKKTKILTVLGVLLAMGITACNGGSSSEASSQEAPATSQAGGDSSVAPSSKAGSSAVTPSSSPTPVEKDATGHIWGADADVAASGEGVAYKKATCTEGDKAIKITVDQANVTYPSGSSRKSGTPDGYTKLSSNNQSMTFKFNYDSYATGKLYFYGCMDGWSTASNRAAGFYYNGNPNIDVKVNGESVDLSGSKSGSYAEWFTDDQTREGELSQDGYAPVGAITLKNGVNELVYTRVQTLNMLIKYFVFVVENGEAPAHQHVAGTEWKSDDNQHWHECVGADCPQEGYKMDVANHSWGDWEVTTAATHDAAGERQRSCTVCGKVVKETVAKLDHSYDADPAASYAAGEGYIATAAYNCNLGCNTSALRWSALDKDASSTTDLDVQSTYIRFGSGAVENKNGSAGTGSHIVYKINVPTAVAKAGLAFKIKNTGGNSNKAPVFGLIPNDSAQGYYDNGDGTFTKAEVRYGLKVNGVEYKLGQDLYGDDHASETNWFEWPVEFPLIAGINTIDVFPYAGYRAQLMEFQVTGLPHVQVTHQHTLGDWKSDDANHWKECTGTDCSSPEGTKFEQAAHTFGEPTVKTPATCTEDGAGEVECTVCGYKKDVVIPAAHKWGAAQEIAAGEGQVSYDLFTCSVCSLMKAEVKANKATGFADYNKDGTPDGYLKLKSNGNEVTWKINVPGTQSLAGTLYQRGAMDSWSSNKTVTYAKSGTGSQGTNFVITVNGVEVDMSATKNVTYETMLKDGVVDSSLSNYSPIADCPIGTIQLQPGENVITYKRLASYNLAISDLVFLGKAHTHAAGTEWVTDDNQHWHACTAAGCPIDGLRLDAADHTWGETTVKTPATCTTAGVGEHECSVCHKKVEVEIPALGHDVQEGTAVANSKGKDVVPLTCSKGDLEGLQMKFSDNNGGVANGKVTVGSTLTWTFKGAKAGTVEFYANAKLGSGENPFADGYKLKIGEREVAASICGKNLSSFGASSSVYAYFLVGTIEIQAADIDENGEVEISYVYAGSQNYRHEYGNNVRIMYVA